MSRTAKKESLSLYSHVEAIAMARNVHNHSLTTLTVVMFLHSQMLMKKSPSVEDQDAYEAVRIL